MSYIKLHRDLLESYAFANPKHLKIWTWLLLKANYKKAYFPVSTGRGFTTVELNRGQLIYGRFKAEEELCMDGSFIYRTLQKFEELGQISIEVNSHFSIITICKYDSYQGQENESEQAMNKHRTTNEQHVNNTCSTDEQHVNTYKEELEEKEEIEEKEFNTQPKFSDFNGLPDQYIESVKLQTHRTKNVLLENSLILDLWQVFKLQNLTGDKFYHHEHDVYKHFVNWFKTQKFESNGTKSKSRSERQSESMHYLLRKGQEEYAKLMATNSQSQEPK